MGSSDLEVSGTFLLECERGIIYTHRGAFHFC